MKSTGWLFRWYDLILVNIYWTGITTLSQTVGLLYPVLVQNFVGETSQGSYLGTLRLWSLMVALLIQGVMGTFSDHSHHPWGRRKPFIFTGTIADLIFLVGLGFVAGLEGLAGFWFLFLIAILLQVSANTAQAGQQGLIPDLVPASQSGKFSGFKALFELPVPLIIVSFTIGRFFGQGNFWIGLLLLMFVLISVMLLTMLVNEKRNENDASPIHWEPYIRLVFMTLIFTIMIIGAGEFIRHAGKILERYGLAEGTLSFTIGCLGLVCMVLTVLLGVLTSIRISLGKKAAQENPSFTWWIINRLVFFIGATNLGTFAIYFIQERLNFSNETAIVPAANLMLVIGITILISVLPAGWLADFFGKKIIVASAGILAAIGTCFAILASSLIHLYIAGVFIGAATGIFFTSNWALGTSLVPKSEAGKYLGISNLAGAGAGAIGSYIGGPIADFFTKNTPNSPGLGYVVLFSIYGVFFLLSSFALMKVNIPLNDAKMDLL